MARYHVHVHNLLISTPVTTTSGLTSAEHNGHMVIDQTEQDITEIYEYR